MKKTVSLGIAAAAVILVTGCNNFLHDLVPPDGNQITSFSVPGQIGTAQIGDNAISVTVGPAADIRSLVPAISVSPKATLLPVTLPYIQKAFPSANVFREGMGFYTSADRAGYVIDLIKQNPDFSVPVLDEGIDFSGPVSFLVISGLGNIRQYTVNVEVDTGEGKFLSFGFSKFDNPDLTRGDAVVTVDNDAKTVNVEVWYPVENIASFTLVPSFQTNGAVVGLEGVELSSGVSEIDFTKPGSGGWNATTETKALTLERPGFAPVDYTLTVTFREDPDTNRSITDFRFDETHNYDLKYTAMGEITDSGDTGSITVRVHHTGAVPPTLTPTFVSPGKVSVESVSQTSGSSPHDFTRPIYYTVLSRNNAYTRTYRVTVEFVNEEDSRPRIQSFAFTTAANAALEANTSALIDHDAGLIVIEAVHSADPPPYSLIPEFTAGGTVSVNGVIQTSGLSVQDFSRPVKYTVRDPGNPGLYREYRVEARFVKHSLSLAEIREFRFDAADNPGLSKNVTAVIDQGAGTIYALLPFDSLPPSGSGHRSLTSRWLAQGTVTVEGVEQESGVNSRTFAPSVVYRVVSEDGAFYKDYTVTVLEVNARIYVDAGATGDNTGVSWANAFKSLMDACAASEHLPANLSAEIWIAEGIYRPSESRDKAAYFKVRGNTGYYGGFAGSETAKTQRVSGSNTVTITGDLGGGVYAEHLFMNDNLQNRNVAFGEMKFTKARALTGIDNRGSAIYVQLAYNITVSNADFENLQAGGGGGAVYASASGSMSITECGFENTKAGSSGGAVYAFSSGSVIITDSSFENTQTYGAGGAAYVAATSIGYITITDCDFTNTKAIGHNGGGAISSSSGSITLTRCNFKDTVFEDPFLDGFYLSGGGAVQVDSGLVIITDCGFKNTKSENNGGGVYVSTSSSSLTITRCDFTDTESGRYGGAVFAYTITTVTITDCDFTNTKSVVNSGAVYATATPGGSITIKGCDFENTRASAVGAVSASASGGSVTITDCDFTNTESVIGTGGAVSAYANSGGSITITKCNFTNTKSSDVGGAVSAHASSGGSITITDCSFENTESVGVLECFGGAVFAQGHTITISGYTSNATRATDEGGSLYISIAAGGSASISDAVINGASSTTYGGAISVVGAKPSFCELKDVSFTGCTAPQGSILNGNAYFNVSDIGPTYTIRPGCSVNGTPITAGNWFSVLSGSMVYLQKTAINFVP